MTMSVPARDSAKRRATHALVALLALGVPSSAAAMLGGDATSVDVDRAQMASSLTVTPTDAGAVHELRLASGTVVREYAAPNGTVFAVAWEGPWLPDLRQLLGPYFEQYANAAQAKPRARGPLVIREPGLVVEIAGHMRAFVGRAYVPEMVPSGFRAETIR